MTGFFKCLMVTRLVWAFDYKTQKIGYAFFLFPKKTFSVQVDSLIEGGSEKRGSFKHKTFDLLLFRLGNNI